MKIKQNYQRKTHKRRRVKQLEFRSVLTAKWTSARQSGRTTSRYAYLTQSGKTANSSDWIGLEG